MWHHSMSKLELDVVAQVPPRRVSRCWLADCFSPGTSPQLPMAPFSTLCAIAGSMTPSLALLIALSLLPYTLVSPSCSYASMYEFTYCWMHGLPDWCKTSRRFDSVDVTRSTVVRAGGVGIVRRHSSMLQSGVYHCATHSYPGGSGDARRFANHRLLHTQVLIPDSVFSSDWRIWLSDYIWCLSYR